MADEEKSVIQDLFLREKPAKILVGLRSTKSPVYATLLSKDADCTYSHTIKILNMFEKLGIVEFEKTGRIKTVSLTKDGTELAGNMEAIARKFEQIEQALDAVARKNSNNKTNGKPASKKKR